MEPGLDALASAGSGEPLVFVGSGSMTGPDPQATTQLAVQTLRMAGVRGVLAGGWGGLQDVAALHVFLPGEVPHGVLFPQVAVIVHHGGAGTTAAAVRAGRPQVVCPFVGDQPFRGRCMQQLGWRRIRSISGGSVRRGRRATIREAIDEPAMIGAVRRLGDQVRANNGVAAAVDVLERVAGGCR